MEGEDLATPSPAPYRNISNASLEFVGLTRLKLTSLNYLLTQSHPEQPENAKRNSQRDFFKMTYLRQLSYIINCITSDDALGLHEKVLVAAGGCRAALREKGPPFAPVVVVASSSRL